MSKEILGLASRDLACYAVATHPEFELAAHTRAIVDKLEAVERGEIKRLMVFLPPRHGKSMLSTQIFPAWFLGKNPRRYVISASYSQDLANSFTPHMEHLILNKRLEKRVQTSCSERCMRLSAWVEMLPKNRSLPSGLPLVS